MKKKFLMFMIVLNLGVSACKPVITPTSDVSTTTPTDAPTETITPTQTNTPLPVPNITATPAIAPPDYSAAVYLDDRSTPAALVFSFANALNRHEHSRASTYWGSPVDELGVLEDFSMQDDVSSVQVLMGDIYSEGAAGSIYYAVPALFNWTLQDGTHPRSSACLLLRLVQPGNFGAPPITPMNIQRGAFLPVDASIIDADVLANACVGVDYGSAAAGNPPESQELENPADLSYTNYIDNRSGAVELVSSLFNAINRKEYVRAYTYWKDPFTSLGNYDEYAAGFNDTETITATFGQVISDAGAGQWYYQVPVAQIVQTSSGETQTFVGCYTLHLSNPAFQGVLPFEPMAITQGNFDLVANGVDLAPLLAAACN